MSSQKRSRSDYETNGPPAHAPFAIYGTPLPAFDPEVRDDGSYVPVWKQEVTDERGRKRLHGAFTGGWSAGYFNTVGSKEGWTPATFVSSRNNRAAQAQAQRADDFMDEEDRAEQAESQKLELQGSFAGLGDSGNNVTKGMFSDLFRTTGETMGVKLLQKMGWRQGQGIGAKVQRLAQGDKAGEGHMFAPENARIVTFTRKNDRKGIGFAGETSLSKRQDENDDDDGNSDVDARILSTNRSKVLTRPKKIKKSSFGVGVLNDTGSDDEDPYSIGPQINYNRVIGGNKKKKKAGVTMTASTAKSAQPVVQKLASPFNNLGGFRKCHDGKLPIQGFVLSAKLILPQENKHPPPEVPSDWQSTRLAATSKDSQYVSAADAAKASTLDADARAALLGESQLPGKSVFDFLTPAARDKLAAASGKTNLPQAGSEGRPADFTQPSAPRSMWDIIPRIEKATAAAALHRGSTGWMPYAEDLDKRNRYKAFLSLNAGLSKSTPQRPESFSTDEWMREMKEFVQAAEVFKPISGLMAARFTSSASAPAHASDQPDTPAPAPQKVDDPAEEAAKIGMFGHLTRVRILFHPTRLLCKRFGVKPPASSHVDPDAGAEHGGSAADTSKSDLVSQASINRMMLHAKFSTSTSSYQRTHLEEGNNAQQEHAKVDATHNEALEGHRADEKTLKDIFES